MSSLKAEIRSVLEAYISEADRLHFLRASNKVLDEMAHDMLCELQALESEGTQHDEPAETKWSMGCKKCGCLY